MRLVRARYIPANNQAQHNAARARHGIPPTANGSMAELLVSPQVQNATLEAARAIKAAAKALAAAELTSDSSTGAYEESIDAVVATPIVAGGSPRAAAAVTAHGGYEHWHGSIGPETSHAVVVEFDLRAEDGGSKAPPRPAQGRRILGRAGAPFDSGAAS